MTGRTPTSINEKGQVVPANPGFLEDNYSTPGVTTDNTSNDGKPPGGLRYNPILGPGKLGGMDTDELQG